MRSIYHNLRKPAPSRATYVNAVRRAQAMRALRAELAQLAGHIALAAIGAFAVAFLLFVLGGARLAAHAGQHYASPVATACLCVRG